MVVKMDKDTEKYGKLEYVHVLVKSSAHKILDVYKRVQISALVHQERVMEETSSMVLQCKCWLWNKGASSNGDSMSKSNIRVEVMSSNLECSVIDEGDGFIINPMWQPHKGSHQRGEPNVDMVEGPLQAMVMERPLEMMVENQMWSWSTKSTVWSDNKKEKKECE